MSAPRLPAAFAVDMIMDISLCGTGRRVQGADAELVWHPVPEPEPKPHGGFA